MESKNDKTEILEELEDKLFDEYLINEVRWGHDDAGVIIEIFTGEAEGRRLRDNLPRKVARILHRRNYRTRHRSGTGVYR